MKLWCLILLCAWPAQAALACAFQSNVKSFAVAAPLVDAAELPAPEIEEVSVTRGLGGAASCDQRGFLTVRLRWPRGSSYDLEDIGFEYRVVRGQAPEGMLPAEPVAADASGRRTEHLFTWQDGAPAQQQALQLQVEVRAVTPDRRRGPPATLAIEAAPGT
ncbi:MAG TPA: hypothetical protein VFF91_02930 [Pseudoxanthomonas sp.]|nr:hypothetical protein [Pseudoxanthomonas sp.]